jgi:hypothetical protein
LSTKTFVTIDRRQKVVAEIFIATSGVSLIKHVSDVHHWI